MANNDILQYLRETPHNTNVNVVKGMIGNESGGGAVEMETVFDEDIMLTYEANGYSMPNGSYSGQSPVINDGYLKITLDNFIIRALSENGGGGGQYQLFDTAVLYTVSIGVGNELGVIIYSPVSTTDPDLQTYCQEPHHLKIEWFNL